MKTGLSSLTDAQIRDWKWYYQVELRPGVYTGGIEHRTAAMARQLLERANLQGVRSLDIGTMEGLMPVSLRRMGAAQVVAYDRVDRAARIALVKEAYGVDFDYRYGMQLGELPAELAKSDHSPFDVVMFAGVLYHMIDPLAGLAMARSFVREQGLLLVETASVLSEDMVLFFNDRGRLHPFSTYFLPSLGWLDYALRMLRLKPIDCIHISRPEIGSRGRVAIVCRAVDRPLPFTGDEWMTKQWVEMDFGSVGLNFSRLSCSDGEVGFNPDRSQLRFHQQTGSVDIFQTVLNSRAIRRDEAKGRLNLSDYI